MTIKLKRKRLNSEAVFVRMPESLKEQVAIQADKEDRNFSEMARILISEAIEARRRK